MAETQTATPQVPDNGPQQIDTPPYPGTTKIDNGQAFDIAGKPLGAVNENGKPTAQAAAPQAAPSAFNFGFKPAAAPAGAAPAAATAANPSTFDFGFKAAPQTPQNAAYTSLLKFAKAFNVTTSGSENGDELAKKVSDWVQAQPPDWAKNLSPDLQGYAKIGTAAVGLAKGMYDAQKHEMDTGISAMKNDPTILGKAAGGVRYVQGILPIVGPVLGAVEDNFAKGEYAEGLGTIAAILFPGALEHFGPKLIENASTALKNAAVTDTKRYIQATKNVDSAKVMADGRAEELQVATQQVKDAEAQADAARQAQVGGTGSKEAADAAASNASAARANLNKATTAASDARDAHAAASAKAEQLANKTKQSVGNAVKIKTATPEQVEKAHEDFSKAIPPKPGKANYTPEDRAAVRPILEKYHAGDTAINSPESVIDALESDRVARDNKVLLAVDKYKNEPIKLVDDDGAQTSVKQKLVDALKENEAVRPGFTEAALKELDRFNTTDPSVGEADALRKTLNNENRDALNTPTGWRDIADARDTDPKFAARYELQDILRDGVYGKLEDMGVEGARESRNLDASVIRVKNAAMKQLNKGEVKVRGTGEAGPIRKTAAWLAEKGGIAGGAAVGASTSVPGAPEAGAVAGGVIGKKVAGILNPGDLTRGKLLERSLGVKIGGETPTIDMSKAGPSNPPSFEMPPEAEVPVNPRENTDLHASLAAHYDEQIGDSSYEDLENRLLQDIAIKKKYGVPVDPAEKKLNLEINKSKVEEIQKARGEHEEQIKATEKAAAEKAAAEKSALESDERVAHSPVMKATEPVLPIENASGHTSEQAHKHEHGHIMAATAEGLNPIAFLTKDHPEVAEGNGAAQVWTDSSDAAEGDKGLAQRVVTHLGGPAFDEVHHDIPLSKNAGARTDIAQARRILRDEGGLSGAALDKVFDALYDRAKEHVSNPEALSLVQANSVLREAGLHKNFHMSPGRLEEYVNKLRGVYGNGETPSGEGIREGGADRGLSEGKSSDTGTVGEKQNGAAKGVRAEAAREGDETGGGKGTSGKRERSSVSKPEVPKERSTGEPEVDEAIRKGGAIPGGTQPGFDYTDKATGEAKKFPDLALFHDAESGTTLAHPKAEVTPEVVANKLRESRAQYSKTEKSAIAKYHPDLQKVVDQNKLVDSIPHDASFITPDGRFVDLSTTHPEAIKKATGEDFNDGSLSEKIKNEVPGAEDNRIKFINDTGAIRARLRDTAAGKELVVSVPKQGVTPEQALAIRKSVGKVGREGNLVMERTDATPDNGLYTRKEFPRVSDVDQMLRDIQAHPDQKGETAQIQAHEANGGSTFTPEGKNLAGTDTHAVAPYPERSQLVDKLTPENLAAYKEKNADLLADGQHAVGTWKDPDSGKTYLDISKTIADRDEAIKAGQDANQKAIYNLKTGETIPTGGTGEPVTVEKSDIAKSSKYEVPDFESFKKDFEGDIDDRDEESFNFWKKHYENNPPSIVYRVVGVKSPKDINLKKPGSFWSVDPETAMHAADATGDIWSKGTPHIITAKISPQDVDWPETLRANVLFGAGESEINLHKNAKPSVQDISKYGESPKGSTVPLMQNPLPVKGTMEGNEIGTLDITKALNQFSKKQLPSLKPGSEPTEMVARARKLAEDEAKYQLAQSKTGTEWYTTEMKDHDNQITGMRPELLTGPETEADTPWAHTAKMTLFKAAEAILSSGQKPYANVKSAVKAWDLYQETGKFPPTNPATGKSWGPRGAAGYGNAFDAVNRLIETKGEKGAADWLLSEHPVSELRDYNKSVSGKQTDQATGAMILGEKRGPFMQNLHGIESKFTADMWVSRTWNRWMGTLDTNPRIEEKGKMTSESDSPRNNAERGLMKESFSKTADKLGLTTSSLQAVLWYYEQALYRAHGIPVESWSFSDAAKRVAGEHAAVPEAEQTGFHFGENAKEAGGASALSNLPRPAGTVHAMDLINALRNKVEKSNITQEPKATYSVPNGWSETGPKKAPGMIQPGNIDLTKRPVVKNDDGTTSSEYSTSFQDEKGHEVLVPTVVDGKFLTPDGKKPKSGSPEEKAMFQKAWQHYKQTGQHLGIFDSPDHADAVAEQIHNRPKK